MRKPIVIASAAALFAAALVVAQKPQASQAQVGQPAPAFTLKDTEGKSHSLSSFKGKYVVLEWTNHQCPFVVKHYASGNMQKLQKWAKDKGVVWLTILSSAPGKQGYLEPAEAKRLMKEQGFNSTAYLFDTDGKVGKAYGARTTPHMYVIDPKGTLIYMGGIDDKPTANQADIAGARNHVMEALKEAMAGKAVSVPSTQPYGCSVKYAD
ncbi:MAG: thioredoxin family protein [Fimbriimonadaceae bacterium]